MSLRHCVFGLGVNVFIAGSAMADVSSGIQALEVGDVTGAVEEFQLAYESGDADGAFYIGRLFELGLGTDQDMRRATHLYAAAAAKGSAMAQNRLGLMHLNSEYVLQDYKRATELLCASAKQGDVNGKFNCGLMYSEGKGVPIDAVKAVSYWSEAAEANHVAAINYLGQAYRDGIGVEANPQTAFEQFSLTANAGNPMGLHELAKAYASGVGVERNPIKAHGFANLAVARGLEEARILRDEIALQLDEAALEQAQVFAREWVATPLEQAG